MTANEAAYGEALSAIADPAALDLDQKLDTAAKSPLRIGAIAADVAKLGRACAEHGVADAKADAESATLLAEACAGSSALLVGTNRNVTATDEVAEQANAFARPVDTD
jgi:formiminotetrahydrofolate cyclodeaminase